MLFNQARRRRPASRFVTCFRRWCVCFACSHIKAEIAAQLVLSFEVLVWFIKTYAMASALPLLARPELTLFFSGGRGDMQSMNKMKRQDMDPEEKAAIEKVGFVTMYLHLSWLHMRSLDHGLYCSTCT